MGTMAALLVEILGDGFAALGEGVQAAKAIATNTTARPNRPKNTSKSSDDLTAGLGERNALD
jgi:hypothetical protein